MAEAAAPPRRPVAEPAEPPPAALPPEPVAMTAPERLTAAVLRRPPTEDAVPEPAVPAVPASRLSQWARLAAVAALVGLVVIAQDLAALVLLGAVLAYLLLPLVDRVERRGVDRTMATALVLLGLVAAGALVVALALPAALDQVASLQARWESGELLALLRNVEATLAARFGLDDPSALGLVESVREALGPGGRPLIGYVPDALETVGNAVVVPFVLFALLKDGPSLRRRLLSVVPNRYFEFTMTVFYKADAHLGGYLRGQALIALLVGTSTAVGLGLLGVDYYLVLGLVTGLANFVPYVGFVVSAGLAVLVSVVTTGDTGQVGGVVLLFGALQLVENVVFQPWITGKNVSMHPVVVLLAILVGGRIGGVMGMALAVPVAAVLKVLFLETAIGLRRYHL